MGRKVDMSYTTFCYYCSNPGAQSRGAQQPARCGTFPCPEFIGRYKDPVVENVKASSLKEIPYTIVDTSAALQNRCWFCFLETAHAQVKTSFARSLLWCGQCALVSVGNLPEHRVAGRTRTLLAQYSGIRTARIVCPCPGCHATLRGDELIKTRWRGEEVLLCTLCSRNGPTDP